MGQLTHNAKSEMNANLLVAVLAVLSEVLSLLFSSSSLRIVCSDSILSSVSLILFNLSMQFLKAC